MLNRLIRGSGYDPAQASASEMVVYRLRGPFFFGAAARLGSVLDQIADHPHGFVVDFTEVPFIDSSGARSFELLARKMARQGGQLFLIGANAGCATRVAKPGSDARRRSVSLMISRRPNWRRESRIHPSSALGAGPNHPYG